MIDDTADNRQQAATTPSKANLAGDKKILRLAVEKRGKREQALIRLSTEAFTTLLFIYFYQKTNALYSASILTVINLLCNLLDKLFHTSAHFLDVPEQNRFSKK